LTTEPTLADLRVLDLSVNLAGAFCARQFAAYGADVIMIECPTGNPLRETEDWNAIASGKSSLTLNLATPSGRAILRNLVEGSNVVVETFPKGHLESLGLGFEDLYGIKRRIILVSIPGEDDQQAACLAGLNAFAAAAIAAHNADAYEVPQHIQIDAGECLTTMSAAAPGDLESLTLGPQLFEMSEVLFDQGEPPALGQHTSHLLRDELTFDPRDLPRLRASGVI
jgi:crotonobetainyl-CoA:carnitine CoA-transferase CaiB-like acyl-CoA transferase